MTSNNGSGSFPQRSSSLLSHSNSKTRSPSRPISSTPSHNGPGQSPIPGGKRLSQRSNVDKNLPPSPPTTITKPSTPPSLSQHPSQRSKTCPSRLPDEDKIIIGIDFGTTHSAVAWATTSSPDDYEVIAHWPGQVGKDWGKVPSDILYLPDPEKGAEGASLPFKWGFEVYPLSPHRISWIKILLDPTQPRPQFVNPKRTVLPPGKKPVDIVTDYLSALRKYALLTIERRLGRSSIYDDAGKLKKRVDFVLTVPAVWSDKARQTTMEAAVNAGLGVENKGNIQDGPGLLRLITEPEGAAEYALRSMYPGMLKSGQCFVVCDAGGGTVDLISYKVTSLTPLHLHECVVGSGGLCGAVYLDRRFEEFVVRRISQKTYDSMSHRAKFQMNQYWENFIKRDFTDTDHSEYEERDFHVPVVGVPDDEQNGLFSGFLSMTRQDVRELFEPVVKQVIQLIEDQVVAVKASGAGTVSAILLVGGFGSSEYLYRSIAAWAGESLSVLQPRNAWTAVVRGAIIRGLQGEIAAVQSRLSRRHYGVVHDAQFDATKHSEDDKQWHPLRCEWVVRNRMRWYIHRGDVTTESKIISFPFYRTIKCEDVQGDTHQLRTELWVCDAAIAPEKRDASVSKLAVMHSQPVGVERFSKHINEKGEAFWRVDYSLEMTVTSGLVIYEMRIEGQKETVGRVSVVYE